MVCLAAWTTEALCSHSMMAQDVPADEHFETVSARNIYIQTRRAIHEFNVLQRRIARGVSLLQYVVPSPDGNTTYGQYRVHPNGFLRALGSPEENYALGTAADEALLSRQQPHRNFDSNSPPESPPTPATPATPPPITNHSDTYPLSLSLSYTSSFTQHTTTASGFIHFNALDHFLSRFHYFHPFFSLGSFTSTSSRWTHLWQATRRRTTSPALPPADSTEVPSPPPPEPSS